jgi:hypothetical protein
VLPKGHRKFCSAECSHAWHGGRPIDVGLRAIARARVARAERGERAKRPASGIEAMPVAAWRRLPGWSRERDAEHVAWFVSTVVPRLHSLRPSDIRRALGCGGTYAIAIRRGARVPHPRLFRQLAGVAGVACPEGFP